MDVGTEVREKGYTGWEGRLIQRRFKWSPIARTGIQLAFRKKRFKPLFAISFLPAFFFLVGIYVAERLEDFRAFFREANSFIAVDPGFFRAYYSNGSIILFILLVLAFAGSGLIADDLKNNSLQLYFSRPLRKKDYILGKLAVPAFFVSLLTFVPGLLFIIFKLIFSGSFRFITEYPWLPLAVVGQSVLYIGFFGLYTLSLSAASRNSRYVMVLVVLVYFFSEILSGILKLIFRSPYTGLFSLGGNLNQITAVFFSQKTPYAFSPVWSFLVLSILAVAGFIFLFRKIRGVEVIK